MFLLRSLVQCNFDLFLSRKSQFLCYCPNKLKSQITLRTRRKHQGTNCKFRFALVLYSLYHLRLWCNKHVLEETANIWLIVASKFSRMKIHKVGLDEDPLLQTNVMHAVGWKCKKMSMFVRDKVKFYIVYRTNIRPEYIVTGISP